jgi:signal peptidase
MKRAIVRGVGAFVWAAALLLVLALAATFVPTLFGMQSLVVGSGSMGAAMPVGSVALTREVDGRSIDVGDIISFRRRGASDTTTHRVVAVKANASQVIFTTKGDVNVTNDPEPVVVDGQIHRVERVVPYAGYIVRAVHTPVGALALIVVPLLGLAFDRKGRRPRRKAPVGEWGWSSTTLQLLNAAGPRSRPAR